jgi:hypothetical protein
MPDDPHEIFRAAVRQLCRLPDTASVLDITRAFVEIRREMHCLLDSVEDDDVVPYIPAGRLVEEICRTELVAYLEGDDSALWRLRNKVKQAAKLLP